LTFQDARLNLLAYVRSEVRNGELTERGFARLIGISQPHAHNVLKGVRTLSPEVFDLVLKYLHLSLLDLAPIEELETQIERRRSRAKVAEVPFLETPVGPGRPWPNSVNWGKTFPAPFSIATVPAELLMANLAPDPAMIATLGSYDIALLDTSVDRRFAISPQGLYVIERRGEAVMRYIRSGAHCYYLVADATRDRPMDWEPLAIETVQLRRAIQARVVWLGRERDPLPQVRDDAIAQPGRLLYDPISS
jgi:hypothetical protein